MKELLGQSSWSKIAIISKPEPADPAPVKVAPVEVWYVDGKRLPIRVATMMPMGAAARPALRRLGNSRTGAFFGFGKD
jgi:hypothetical protein